MRLIFAQARLSENNILTPKYSRFTVTNYFNMPVPFGKFYMADKNIQALLIPKDWNEMDAESESSLPKDRIELTVENVSTKK